MRFNKIKFDNEKQKWLFKYEKPRQNDADFDEYSFMSKDEPRRELIEARDGLIKFVVEICELPEKFKERISIIGVTFTYSGEENIMGAVISAKMELKNSNSPLILNTPHKISEAYNEGTDEKQLMPDGMAVFIDELQAEAEKYIDGERAQGEIFSPSPIPSPATN